MKSHIKKRISIYFLVLLLGISFSCSGKKGYQLGIQVPIGDAKVSDELPYLVSGVFEDSPAYKAGVRPNDIIIQVDGTELKGLQHSYIYNKLLIGKPGTDVTLVIERDGKNVLIVVKRGE